LVACYLIARLVYFDADIPVWAVSSYAPIDEFYYTLLAFDLAQGGGSPDGAYVSGHWNLLQQVVTASSLALFGDNYYGLRFPSVLSGLLVLIVFYRIIFLRFGLFYSICFSLLLLVEYSFLLATRVAEPTIFRLAITSVLLFFYVSEFRTASPRYFLIGFLTCAAWLFVYLTNAFLVLAGVACVLIFSEGKYKVRALLLFSVGALTALLLFILLLAVTGFDFINALGVLSAVEGRVSGGSSFYDFIYGICINYLSILRANFFASNPYVSPVFLGLIFSPFLLGRYFFHQLRREDWIVICFFAAFFVQLAFVNDYPQRKLVMIVPFLLYFFVLSGFVFSKRFGFQFNYFFAVITFLFSVSFSVVSYSHVYAAPAFEYKKAMSALDSLGLERFVGGWSYGFRLYSSYRPYLSKYQYIYTDPERYYATMTHSAVSGFARFTLEYGDDETVAKMAIIGFYKKRLVFSSNDPIYPDVYLYEFSRRF